MGQPAPVTRMFQRGGGKKKQWFPRWKIPRKRHPRLRWSTEFLFRTLSPALTRRSCGKSSLPLKDTPGGHRCTLTSSGDAAGSTACWSSLSRCGTVGRRPSEEWHFLNFLFSWAERIWIAKCPREMEEVELWVQWGTGVQVCAANYEALMSTDAWQVRKEQQVMQDKELGWQESPN